MNKTILTLMIVATLIYTLSNHTISTPHIKRTNGFSFEESGSYEKEDDKEITQNVKAALENDHDLQAEDVAVSTKNGIVQLSGDVSSHADQEKAVKLALNMRGVQAVKNDL